MKELAEQYIEYANFLNSQGFYQQAIDYYNTSILITPKLNAAIYNNRAIAYLNLARYEQAYNDIDMAISLSPELAISYFLRAQINLAKHNISTASNVNHVLQAAIDDYHRAAELDPTNKIYSEYEIRAKQLYINFQRALLIPITDESSDLVQNRPSITEKQHAITLWISVAPSQARFQEIFSNYGIDPKTLYPINEKRSHESTSTADMPQQDDELSGAAPKREKIQIAPAINQALFYSKPLSDAETSGAKSDSPVSSSSSTSYSPARES